MNWLVLTVIVLVACVTKISSAGSEGLRISFKNVTASDDGSYDFINVCEVGTSFSVVCEILVTRSGTNTTMEMTTSDSKILGTQTGNRSTSDDGNYFRYEFEVAPEYGGNITMTCLASNVLDPAEDEASVEGNVIIQKPSNYGPTIRVTMPGIVNKPYWDTGSLEANDGDQLKLDCTSPLYNYPGFSSITIRCDLTNENVSMSDETNAVLTIDLELVDVKCYCEAEHVTGCYDKVSELTIKSVWGPIITKFEQNPPEPQNQSMPCWEPNMFMCEALGYPFQSLTVTNERTGIAVPGKCTYIRADFAETRIFFYKKLEGYEDMGNYVCTADNGRGQVDEEKIFVNVESKPLLFSPSNDGNVETFNAKNGTVWEIRIPILSHPVPTNYTVSYPEDNRVVTDGYNVTYLPTTPPPNGTVVLSLLVSVREGREAEQFVLTIDNGLGTVDYRFEIAIPKEEVADSDSGGLSDGEKAGIGIGVALIVIILIVAAVIAFKKRQKPGRYDTNTTATFTNGHGH